jgi:NusA-like KH domain protein
MKIVLDQQTLHNIALFQKLTHVPVVDSIENEVSIYFIIRPGYKLFALGRNGEKLMLLQKKFKKKVMIVEFDDNITNFIKNLVPESQDIIVDNKEVKIRVSKYDKPRVIGKDKRNLMIIQKFLNRLFDIENVRIL